jgi:hypothetical protein
MHIVIHKLGDDPQTRDIFWKEGSTQARTGVSKLEADELAANVLRCGLRMVEREVTAELARVVDGLVTQMVGQSDCHQVVVAVPYRLSSWLNNAVYVLMGFPWCAVELNRGDFKTGGF